MHNIFQFPIASKGENLHTSELFMEFFELIMDWELSLCQEKKKIEYNLGIIFF